MRQEFTGNIITVREVEDCIRATKKYKKVLFRKVVQHPIQGEDFPSRVLTEYYEIYPEMEVGWNMAASDFFDWVWGDTPHIDVRFHYNYQENKGRIIIFGNNGVLDMLKEGIPNFNILIIKLKRNDNKNKRN